MKFMQENDSKNKIVAEAIGDIKQKMRIEDKANLTKNAAMRNMKTKHWNDDATNPSDIVMKCMDKENVVDSSYINDIAVEDLLYIQRCKTVEIADENDAQFQD